MDGVDLARATPGGPVAVDPSLESVSGPPTTRGTCPSRDDADVPHALRIAAAWSWRLIVIGVCRLGVCSRRHHVGIVIIPVAVALLLSALLPPAVRLAAARPGCHGRWPPLWCWSPASWWWPAR